MGETVPNLGLVLVKPVILIGMMGAGKSAVGRAVAASLGAEIRDSDEEIVASAQQSIAEIFDRYGEPFFREKEAQIIARLLAAPPAVLSTGGGAWLRPENRALMADRAVVIWLDVPLDVLWSRVRHKSHRPLLQTDDPQATLAAIYAERQPLYATAPYRVAVAPDWSIDRTRDAVLAVLHSQGAVRPKGDSQ